MYFENWHTKASFLTPLEDGGVSRTLPHSALNPLWTIYHLRFKLLLVPVEDKKTPGGRRGGGSNDIIWSTREGRYRVAIIMRVILQVGSQS